MKDKETFRQKEVNKFFNKENKKSNKGYIIWIIILGIAGLILYFNEEKNLRKEHERRQQITEDNFIPNVDDIPYTDDNNDNKSLAFTDFSGTTGSFIPEYENSKSASFVLSYSLSDDANRPSCEIKFKNGFEIYTVSSCEGDYFWCLTDNYNNELGSMKLLFTKSGDYAFIQIKEEQYAKRYKKYIAQLKGKLKRI